MKIFLINVKTICAKRSSPPFFSFIYSFWELTIFVCFYKNEVLSQNSTVTFFPFKTNAFDGAAVKVTLLNLDLWPTLTSGYWEAESTPKLQTVEYGRKSRVLESQLDRTQVLPQETAWIHGHTTEYNCTSVFSLTT